MFLSDFCLLNLIAAAQARIKGVYRSCYDERKTAILSFEIAVLHPSLDLAMTIGPFD